MTVEINFLKMLHRVRLVEEGAKKDRGPDDPEQRKQKIEKFHKDTAKPQGRFGDQPAGMIRVGSPFHQQHHAKKPKE